MSGWSLSVKPFLYPLTEYEPRTDSKACPYKVLSHDVAAAVPAQGSPGSGQSGHRHPEGGAAHEVKADFVDEGDAPRVAAVFATDAYGELGLGPSPLGHGQSYKPPHALLIQSDEGVSRKDTLLQIEVQELPLRIVSGKGPRRLGEVVGAEAEVVRLLGQISGDEGCPRRLDHGAEAVADLHPHLLLDLPGH